MHIVVPEKPNVLTPKQKQKSLRDVKLFKERRCGKMKGLTCDDGII